MDKKSKKELLAFIGEQNKSLSTYKSRMHDLIEAYKGLVQEKQALESSIQTLTNVNSLMEGSQKNEDNMENEDMDSTHEKKVSEECIHMLKSSFAALTTEKSRAENELRADRKKLLQEKEEIEKVLYQKENEWFLQKNDLENQMQEMKKKINNQQREREKEQQNHALMLKELQNLLANERASKEKLDQQVLDWQSRLERHKLPEKKALEYERHIESLKGEIKSLKEKLIVSEEKDKKKSYLLKSLQEETDKAKMQYNLNMEKEKKRSEETKEQIQLLITVKEKRIATLEAHLSELSTMIGNYDKLRQQDQLSIQKLKDKVDHLHSESSSAKEISAFCDQGKKMESEIKIHDIENRLRQLKDISPQADVNAELSWSINEAKNEADMEINLHASCELELLHTREELEHYKAKAESALKEKYKTSSTLVYDMKTKEIKELKSQVTKLQEHLQTAKSQLKLGEEYHNKITTNLEKFIEELKLKQKQEITHLELENRATIIELEHQIQKQRERTLSLLEEKEKEISMLKSSFLPQLAKKDSTPMRMVEDLTVTPDSDSLDDTGGFISNSLILTKKDGHILHYMQELSRKDIEITNLRHCRIQTESALRKLQQSAILTEEKNSQELDSLKSRIKLLESSKSEDGTNVEYLKNVILRFLKCNDLRTQRHMINAIATVLHFTNSELQEVKAFAKTW